MRSLFRLAVKNPFRVWIDCPFFSTTSGGRFRHLKHRSLEGSTSRYSKTPSEAFPSKTCRACCRRLGMSSGMSVQAMSVGTSVARRTSLPVKTSVTMSLTRHWMISPDFGYPAKVVEAGFGSLVLIEFPEQFGLGWMSVHSRAGGAGPFPATSLAHKPQSRASQARAALFGQGVGNHSSVAHCSRSSPRCPVKHRASVSDSIGAATVYLKRPAVISHSADRPAHDSNPAYLPAFIGYADRKLVANNWVVVPMVLGHKSVSLIQGDGDHLQANAISAAHCCCFHPFRLSTIYAG